MVVTALNIQLFGTREDRATGRGSAIIATPDGRQTSFLVGEEIMPGVMLTGVGFDHVTITRGGVAEQLFIDQSPADRGSGARRSGARLAGLAPPTGPRGSYVPQPVPVVRAPPAPPPPPPPQMGNTTQPMRVSQ